MAVVVVVRQRVVLLEVQEVEQEVPVVLVVLEMLEALVVHHQLYKDMLAAIAMLLTMVLVVEVPVK